VASVIAVFIPIVAVGGFFLWMISLSPVGRAYAHRLKGGSPDDRERDALREEVASLRLEVAELAERVDFTERLLAKQQEVVRLERPH
jgi:hypothetical protein